MQTHLRSPPDPPSRRDLARRLGAAALSGVLLVAAFPGADMGWLGFVALVPLCLALRGASGRMGALVGLVFGGVFFGALLTWISYFGYAAWSALLVVLTAPIVLFGVLAARASRSLGIWGRVAGWPLLFAGMEMLRGRWPVGGFTWGGLGYTQHGGGPGAHLARTGGVYVVTVVLFAVNALIAEAIATGAIRTRARLGVVALLLGLGPLVLPIGIAGARTGTLDVAAVQGNVPRELFTGLGRSGRVGPEDLVVVDNMVRETSRLVGTPTPELVVWPENSLDRDPFTTPRFLEQVRTSVRSIGAPFIIGGILDHGARWTNTNLEFDAQGNVVGRYDKTHLVPFGEYVPIRAFRSMVPALDRELPIDGVAGTHPVIFDASGARLATPICFEVTYPALVRDEVRAGAQALIVTTNDASFGTSAAGRQQLAMAQMRAIEEGRAVVVAAISGPSAVFAPDGGESQRTELFRPAIVRARISLTDGRTPYARYGAAIEAAIAFGAFGVALGVIVAGARARRARA